MTDTSGRAAEAAAVPSEGAAPVAWRRTRRWVARLDRIVRHVVTQLIVALVLIGTSLAEMMETLADDFATHRVRATHGLLVVGLVQLLRALPELIEGIERTLPSARQR
jgi:hypothetical protein